MRRTFPSNYVPSSLQDADSLSGILSDKDCKLAGEPWETVENLFGSHSIDLMALDSNVQVGHSGSQLFQFSPLLTPNYIVVAQDIAVHENAYVFLPLVLAGPLLPFVDAASFLFTMAVPTLNPLLFWWPLIQAKASHSVIIVRKGDRDILLFSSPQNVFLTRPLS